MKRLALAIGSVASVAIAILAVDKFILHPQRQAIKILRYATLADARRIASLEQQAALLSRKIALGDLTAAEQCVSHSVALVKVEYDSIKTQFAACKEAIVSAISDVVPAGSEEVNFLFYLTALTSQLGAYGESVSTDARQIAKDETLNCSQSVYFISQTIKEIFPNIEITEIALFNEALGSHGLVEARVNGEIYVLDGSTGTIYLSSINRMTSPGAKRIKMVDFFDETDPRLATLLEQMTRSVQLGWIRPTHIVSRNTL